ncbi:MAG: hypothetical protein D3906_02595, partial [Candidatus Electrothrix sp. AUS1_2]|nr:hypothetical protein [Candidatus Electrothrix sp. AUS1_2]
GKSVFNGKDGKSVFVDGDGRSAFVNENGESYLRSISSKLNEITVETGDFSLPEANTYNTEFTEGQGFTPVSDTFSSDLTAYISSGIPLISFIRDSALNLSGASSIFSFTIKGETYSFDFSQYESALDAAGNILFYLTVLSSFLLIISRSKG